MGRLRQEETPLVTLLSSADPDWFPQVASGMILVMAFFLITYTFHSTWVTSEAYSSPSIVLSARGGDGSRIIFDDFREAYYWLRHNTPEVNEGVTWASLRCHLGRGDPTLT